MEAVNETLASTFNAIQAAATRAGQAQAQSRPSQNPEECQGALRDAKEVLDLSKKQWQMALESLATEQERAARLQQELEAFTEHLQSQQAYQALSDNEKKKYEDPSDLLCLDAIQKAEAAKEAAKEAAEAAEEEKQQEMKWATWTRYFPEWKDFKTVWNRVKLLPGHSLMLDQWPALYTQLFEKLSNTEKANLQDLIQRNREPVWEATELAHEKGFVLTMIQKAREAHPSLKTFFEAQDEAAAQRDRDKEWEAWKAAFPEWEDHRPTWDAKYAPGQQPDPVRLYKSLLDELTHSERVALKPVALNHHLQQADAEDTDTIIQRANARKPFFLEAGVLCFDKPHDRILAFANLYPLDTGKQVLEKLLRESEHSSLQHIIDKLYVPEENQTRLGRTAWQKLGFVCPDAPPDNMRLLADTILAADARVKEAEDQAREQRATAQVREAQAQTEAAARAAEAEDARAAARAAEEREKKADAAHRRATEEAARVRAQWEDEQAAREAAQEREAESAKAHRQAMAEAQAQCDARFQEQKAKEETDKKKYRVGSGAALVATHAAKDRAETELAAKQREIMDMRAQYKASPSAWAALLLSPLGLAAMQRLPGGRRR